MDANTGTFKSGAMDPNDSIKKKNVHVPLFPTASRLNTSIFPWIADMEPGDLLLETVTEKTEKKKKERPLAEF